MCKSIRHLLSSLCLLCLFFCLGLQSVNANQFARSKSTKTLKAQGLLKISEEQCSAIESKLGQVLYVNVDGNGQQSENPPPISPLYINMIKDLNIGGVLPKPYGRPTFENLRDTYIKIKSSASLPVFLGIDWGNYIVRESYSAFDFGLGYGWGFIGKYKTHQKQCFTQRAYIDALLHKYLGLNQTLGPTIDPGLAAFLDLSVNETRELSRAVTEQFHRAGMITTAKHYPWTPDPDYFNLHDTTKDLELTKEQMDSVLESFSPENVTSEFVMSTHIWSSTVDPLDVATFSKTWVRLLRETGFKGLLMTDALFMFREYPQKVKQMMSRWPQDRVKVDDVEVIYAARALLAGHDFVFLEGDRNDTYRIFDGMLSVACSDAPVSGQLRNRIENSYKRIVSFKSQRQEQLLETPVISAVDFKKLEEMHFPYNSKYETKECLTPQEEESLRALSFEN